MRFPGKVSDFNRITGRGLIFSKAYGDRVKFHTSQVVGGYGKLDAGDQVEFEVSVVDGVPEALCISVMSRLAGMLQQRAAKDHVGKPVEEGKSEVVGQLLTSLPAPPVAAPSPRLSLWPGTLARPDQAPPEPNNRPVARQPTGRASR